MTKKTKSNIYNFLVFVILFLGIRYLLASFFDMHYIAMVLIAAFSTTVLAPKFGVIKVQGKERMFVKWFLFKEIKEL
ncbi:MAG: hypothetical protein OIF50_12035 [Flavobacteriaceae bacterium]|nr:hypothetical protein [Flavobacteriaceae bacterium]